MHEDKVVTILLATHNGERYIKEQIESILAQSNKNWVLLISDDNSSDKTPEIIDMYQKKYLGKIEVLKSIGGFGSACGNFFYLMRKAVDRSAEYIMFCDQDDIWKMNKISITLAQMKKDEAQYGVQYPLLVFTDLQVVDANLNLSSPSFVRYSRLNSSRTALHYLLIQNVVTGCTVMFNQYIGKLALQYHDNKDILMHDWWMALVAAAFGKISFIDVPTVEYRQHGGNAVGAKRISSLSVLYKKIFSDNDIKMSMKRSMLQAEQFYSVYKSLLAPAEQRLVQNYARLYKFGKVRRIKYMIKFRILKYGFFRKIAQFVWG